VYIKNMSNVRIRGQTPNYSSFSGTPLLVALVVVCTSPNGEASYGRRALTA
jgi:hypothetical protein